MKGYITTFEHTVLTIRDFVYPTDFDWLIDQSFIGFDVQRCQGEWQLKVGHYLGIISLPSGYQLEILPKIVQNAPIDIVTTRAWVKNMLLTIWQRQSPKAIEALGIQATVIGGDSLPDWLRQYFWQLLGCYRLNQRYQTLRANQSYLQGKLLVKQQLRHNLHQPHRFYSESDYFVPDTASNRLVNTAYQRLISLGLLSTPTLNDTWQSVTWLRQPTLAALSSLLAQSQQELQQMTPAARATASRLISLSYGILTAQQALPTADNVTSPSLFVNMQTAFEQWVSQVVQHCYHVPIKVQYIRPLVTNEYETILSIKPDLLIQHERLTIVADIKWKAITQVRDIRLADIYQLMAYADETGAGQAWLIYPTTNGTDQPVLISFIKARAAQFWLVPFLVTCGQLLVPANVSLGD